jgi:hypothetical protein
MRASARACLLIAVAWIPASFAQAVEPTPFDVMVRSLLDAIASMSDYRPVAPPPIFEVPQGVLEAKVCELPCNVTAAYVPREGIYLAGNLDPVREPADRAALLHELVHHLQQGHPKFAQLHGCARERAKELEAYALQNRYLEMMGSRHRVELLDGELDCEGARPER